MILSRAIRPARVLLIACVIGLTAALMVASAARAADPTFPALGGRVVDEARILMPDTEAEISAKLAELETQTGDQFVVVTLDSLQGYEIEEFGYRLGRHWGIGQSQTDTGVILIVAPNDRKVRLEVGYGLEPVLTDALSSQIIQNDILPPFRQGGYARGISAGVDAVIAQLTLDPAEAQARAAEAVPANAKVPVFAGIIIALIFVFFFLSLAGSAGSKGRRRGRHGRGIDPVLVWGASEILSQMGRSSSGRSSGGFGSGGGGGFRGGGGSFGGGGASGGW